MSLISTHAITIINKIADCLFAVWVFYGFLLHQRLAIGWKGSRMAVLSCLGLSFFLLSALGIRFCLATVHNFI